jgi:hypothetical protein
MKKLNNKGFGHIEVFIVAAVVVITALIGGFVWQNSKSKSSQAQQIASYWNWNERRVYCSYTACYLRPGPGKAERLRWVSVAPDGFRTCRQTGIVYVTQKTKPPSSPTSSNPLVTYCLQA